jgi:hypothetical protein
MPECGSRVCQSQLGGCDKALKKLERVMQIDPNFLKHSPQCT